MSENLNLPNPDLHETSAGNWQPVLGNTEIAEYERDFTAGNDPEASDSFDANMNDTREIMAAFEADEELNEKTDKYFNGIEDMPPIFIAAKAQSEEQNRQRLTWTGWLANSADNQQILNFLQWHNNRHENMVGSQEFAKKLEAEKSEFAIRANRLKISGYLHEETEVNQTTLANVNVTVKDIFMSHMFGDGHHTDPDSGSIEMVEDYEIAELWHELSHSQLGKLEEDGFDPKQWVNEAVTEHIARSMTDGWPDIVDPEKRIGSDKGKYVLERRALGAILQSGRHNISPKYITRLYSAKTEQARTAAEAELRKQFKLAYGVEDVLERTTDYLNRYIDYGSGVEEEMYTEESAKKVDELVSSPWKALGIKRPEPLDKVQMQSDLSFKIVSNEEGPKAA